MIDIAISYDLNGVAVTDTVASNILLVDYLRDAQGLKGTHIGCSRGVCGACTVLMDGRPIAACSTFAFQIDGTRVTTIEGLADGDRLDPIQQAFVDHAAFQCGYCTAGMIMMTKALLAAHPNPDRATIVEWLSCNVCRCTGYSQIIAAVESLAREPAQ